MFSPGYLFEVIQLFSIISALQPLIGQLTFIMINSDSLWSPLCCDNDNIGGCMLCVMESAKKMMISWILHWSRALYQYITGAHKWRNKHTTFMMWIPCQKLWDFAFCDKWLNKYSKSGQQTNMKRMFYHCT